ncbi:MAG: RdgB/HAM1 family non-canonical purine NTP pyrophosphatase [Alphaproteobacteria bacterium]
MPLSLPAGLTLVAATHNPGKAVEIGALLDGRFTLLAASALGLPEPDETESTFMGNAILKARAAANASGHVALADDSGLCVAALNGDPGIYSARWAGPEKDFTSAMAEVERKLADSGSSDRHAWFVSALAVAWPNGDVAAFEGLVHGELVFPGRGTHGFGYDPIFQPNCYEMTYGEMEALHKDGISHRALAFAKLKAALFE